MLQPYYIINNMKEQLTFFVICMVLLIIQSRNIRGTYLDTVSYNISPQFPSEAFVGQYYSCKFRVNGMQKPTFRFHNLPSFFTASPTGMIQGIPDRTGTFEIFVTYEELYQSDEKNILLRVVEPYYYSQTLNLKKSKKKLVELVNYQTSYVYRVYEDVLINLNKNNKTKYYWTYLNLPQTLQASQEGLVTGFINREGYYSFGATCTDQNGYSIDYFFNLNVQPFVFTGFKKQPVFADLYVQNRITYNYHYILAMYNDVSKNLIKAFNNANQTAFYVLQLKNKYMQTKIEIQTAKKQFNIHGLIVDSANSEKAIKLLQEKKAKQNLDRYQNIYELAETAFKQAVNKAKDVQNQLFAAIEKFNKTKKDLDNSSKDKVQAENELAAALTAVQKIKRSQKSIQQDIEIYIQDISVAKKTLQNARSKKILNDSEVNNARTKKDIAEGTNDQATAEFNKASSALEKQKNKLQEASKNVSVTRFDKNQAERQLGKSKFNLNQALNQLFVAQAAKQQADKALLLASAQASVMPSGETTYIFGGCESHNYPSISGTASIIKKVDPKGNCYQLNSGFSIIPGKCNSDNKISVASYKQGDTISFQGYVKDGMIHGIKVSYK